MGIEYKITLAPNDFAAFENDVRGQTLDRTLRAGPGFVLQDGAAYSFNSTGNPHNDWFETVHIQDDGLWLTLYSRDPLLTYVMRAVLEQCGRLHIEDG